MIYLDTPHRYDPEHDDLEPMAGTRVGHEMLTEDVILIRIDHAEQSFRSARRSLVLLDVIGGRDPEPGSDAWRKLSDQAVNYTGVRSLTGQGA